MIAVADPKNVQRKAEYIHRSEKTRRGETARAGGRGDAEPTESVWHLFGFLRGKSQGGPWRSAGREGGLGEKGVASPLVRGGNRFPLARPL